MITTRVSVAHLTQTAAWELFHAMPACTETVSYFGDCDENDCLVAIVTETAEEGVDYEEVA